MVQLSAPWLITCLLACVHLQCLSLSFQLKPWRRARGIQRIGASFKTKSRTGVSVSGRRETLLKSFDVSEFDDSYYDDDGDDDNNGEANAAAGLKSDVDGGRLDMDPRFPPYHTSLGETVPLDEDMIQRLLSACREEIGTLFGYTAENRAVGITGSIDLVDIEGPVLTVKLQGRFWHQRPTVLERVKVYLQQRCPEVVDVIVGDPYELTDEANNAA